MTVRFGKTEVKKMAALLDQEWDSPEEAAEALLGEALTILQGREKFAIVGQLRYSHPEGGYVSAEDAKDSRACFGLYSTAGDAQKAVQGLAWSFQTQEGYNVWVLPVEHRSPMDFFKERKARHEKRAAELDAEKHKVRPCCPHCEHLPGGVGSLHVGECPRCKTEKAAA